MTLLQHVKFKPVLPALNEIKMTRVEREVLILCRTASRSTLFMVPSSKTRPIQLKKGGVDKEEEKPTSNIADAPAFQERLDQTEHTRELRENNRLFFCI